MAAYLKDVENNTRDMTAQSIIKEKLNRIETKEVSTPQIVKFNFRYYAKENLIISNAIFLRVGKKDEIIFFFLLC